MVTRSVYVIKQADASSAISDYVTFPFYEIQAERRMKFLSEFQNYATPDWDSEGAVAVNSNDIERARTFLRSLPVNVPAPDAAPGADGTVCMDWETAGGVVRVDLRNGVFRYFYRLASGEKDEQSGALESSTMYETLSKAFGHLYPKIVWRISSVPRFTVKTASSPRWSNAA